MKPEVKRYTGASVRLILHIPGAGVDGCCRDVPIKPFGVEDLDTFYYEPVEKPETD